MTDSDRKLRILHLASSHRWTGVAEPLVSLASCQQQQGHRVWLGCMAGHSLERRARQRGLEVLQDLYLSRYFHPLQFLSDLRFIRRFSQEQNIDVLHCHLLHDHWSSAIALLGCQSPVLIRTRHSSISPRGDLWHRWLFLRATGQTICISNDSAQRCAKVFSQDADHFPAIRGAVDLERFCPALQANLFRDELGIPSDAPVAGIVSRMRSGRGLRWLLRAWPGVLQQVPQARLVIVGRGELKKWCRDSEIKKEIYRGSVHYAGYRKDDLPLAYAAMDVSLFLGLGSEGTCRAILEAMGCARPTIGARTGAVPEIIADGQSGLLVEDRSIESLVEKLVAMLSDRPRCEHYGQAARKRAEALFTEQARADAVLEVYRKTLSEPKHRHITHQFR